MGTYTHKDKLENFESYVEGLDVTKMAQVSMDGPNVNVKFLKYFAIATGRKQFLPVN